MNMENYMTSHTFLVLSVEQRYSARKYVFEIFRFSKLNGMFRFIGFYAIVIDHRKFTCRVAMYLGVVRCFLCCLSAYQFLAR